MDILGSIGELYTFILLVVLFLGSGLAAWAGINAILNKRDTIKNNTSKIKESLNQKLQNIRIKDIIGGITMNNNGFIKLAVFSFVGIIISAAILMALPKIESSMGYMNTQSNMTSMNMQGSMQSNMNGQSGMPGMLNYNMTGTMNGNADIYSVQQQLNSIQQQINQLQNQMNNGTMGSMQSNTGNLNSNMNNMNGNMNNNSMNNNNTNNMNSNNMNNSNSSSSSMPMM